jgi:uncharacterized protein YraI
MKREYRGAAVSASAAPIPPLLPDVISAASGHPAGGVNETASRAMRFASQLLSLGVLLASATFATAKPAYVLTTVNLRAAPGTGSEIVTKIPGGSLIDASGCSDGWCEVTWQEKTGYSIQTALDLSGRVPRSPAAVAPAYRPRRGYIVEGPPIYYDPPPAVIYGPYWRQRYWRRWWW